MESKDEDKVGDLMGVKRVLRHSLWIGWKDLLEFSRSRLRLIMLVLMPLFMMVMVGFIFPSGSSISHTPIALANLDMGYNNTTLGNTFVAQLETINNKTGLMVLSTATGFDDIKAKIQDGKVNGGIIISQDFSSALMAGRQGNITIITDQSNPQLSMLIQGVLTKTIEQMGTQNATDKLNTTYNISSNYTFAIIKPYNVRVGGIVPGAPNYFQFVAPGIMAMV